MMGLRLLEEFVHATDLLSVRIGRRTARPAHLEVGRKGEEAALFHLRRQGYTVVARDWRSGKVRGDLDLVAWEGNTLCFVEVKTRTSRVVVAAEVAVDHEKMRTLRRLARQYLLTLPTVPNQVRFDIVSIYHEPQLTLELIRDAFSLR